MREMNENEREKEDKEDKEVMYMRAEMPAKDDNMPKQFEKKLKERGGAIRWRTRSLPNGEFQRLAITRYVGPRGGRTLAESPRLPKRLKA